MNRKLLENLWTFSEKMKMSTEEVIEIAVQRFLESVETAEMEVTND